MTSRSTSGTTLDSAIIRNFYWWLYCAMCGCALVLDFVGIGPPFQSEFKTFVGLTLLFLTITTAQIADEVLGDD